MEINIWQFAPVREFKPLQIGVFDAMEVRFAEQAGRPLTHEERVSLSDQLKRHTQTKRYLEAMLHDMHRYDLDGIGCDAVTIGDRIYSSSQLSPSKRPVESLEQRIARLRACRQDLTHTLDIERAMCLGRDIAETGLVWAQSMRPMTTAATRPFTLHALAEGEYPGVVRAGDPPITDGNGEIPELLREAEFYERGGKPELVIAHVWPNLLWKDIFFYSERLDLQLSTIDGAEESWFLQDETIALAITHADTQFPGTTPVTQSALEGLVS